MILHIEAWRGWIEVGQQPAKVRTGPTGTPCRTSPEPALHSIINKTKFREGGGQKMLSEFWLCFVRVSMCRRVFVCNRVTTCSSPESHCVRGAGS